MAEPTLEDLREFMRLNTIYAINPAWTEEEVLAWYRALAARLEQQLGEAHV